MPGTSSLASRRMRRHRHAALAATRLLSRRRLVPSSPSRAALLAGSAPALARGRLRRRTQAIVRCARRHAAPPARSSSLRATGGPRRGGRGPGRSRAQVKPRARASRQAAARAATARRGVALRRCPTSVRPRRRRSSPTTRAARRGRRLAADPVELRWPVGVNAPEAWGDLIAARAPGGRGVTVAVLDTGVAYRPAGRYRRSPDFAADRFVARLRLRRRDPYPHDRNGHGTHVASTIAEATNNGVGADRPGLRRDDHAGPRARQQRRGRRGRHRRRRPLRRPHGRRRDQPVASSSRPTVTAPRRSPSCSTRSATRTPRGGDRGRRRGQRGLAGASPTRRARRHVIAVGATTEHGCHVGLLQRRRRARHRGAGRRRATPAARGRDANCRPAERSGRDDLPAHVRRRRVRRSFGLPRGYEGTSMAAPHVSARRRAGDRQRRARPGAGPAAVERALERTARDLGPPGRDRRYGAGLIDAAARATSRARGCGHGASAPREPRLGRADDQHGAGRVVGDLVRHRAQQEALGAGHALVADDDQVGVVLLGDVEDGVGRVALARVDVWTSTPASSACSAASLSVASTSSRGLTIHCRSSGDLLAPPRAAASSATGS